MEPLDTAKNDENIGTSKRRISSILKAPRTSIKFADPEHVEALVEVAKPVEKRTSRRVSFASANDVLLFSKDVKNGSSVRSPLRNIKTAAVENPDKRIQMGVNEERIQPITGMETLLKAPLHVTQQKTKETFMVSHDTEDDYGEKTMMFTANDASMDVTHSHTVIIANDPESPSILPDKNCEILPTFGNMDFTFPTEKRKAETCDVPRNIHSSVIGLDPEFENFLASISKPSAPRSNPMMTKVVHNATVSPQETVDTNGFLAQLKTKRSALDKENRAPPFMSKLMEKPLHAPQKIGESSNRSVVFPEYNEGMDTETLKGHIVMNAPTDEPLKCMFPTPDLWHSDHWKSTEINLGQQSTDALRSISSNPGGMGNTKKVSPIVENATVCHTYSHAHHILGQGEDTRYKTPESYDMELTQSQTVAIDTKSINTDTTLPNKRRKSFVTASSKTNNVFETDPDDMDITRCQTRVIEAKHLAFTMPSLSVGTGQPIRVSENDMDMNRIARQGEGSKYNTCESDDMEITRSQTVAIDAKSLHIVNPLQNRNRKSLAFMTTSNKASNTSADECGMDMTKALTVSIDHISQSGGSRMSDKPLDSLLPKTDDDMMTWRREADHDDMEFTSCQTRIIEAKNLDLVTPSLSVGTGQPITISEDDMDVNRIARQGEGSKYNTCESDDMEITRSQTVAIDAKSLHIVNPLQNRNRKSLAFMTTSNKASNTSADECGMDMTKALTVSIDHISQSGGSRMSDKPLDSLLPKTDDDMMTWRREADSDDMEFTSCQTRVIEAKNVNVVKPLLSVSTGGHVGILDSSKKFLSEDDMGMNRIKHQGEGSNYNTCETDDMEITRSQTVAIDAERLHTVNPLQNKKQKSLAFMTACTKASNTSEDECGMDVTKALTVSIDHISQSGGSRMLDKPLDSLLPKTDHEMGALDRPGPDSDDMEFTSCQTRVIEAKHLDVVKPSLNTDSVEKASQNVSHFFQRDKAMTKIPTTAKTNVLEDGNLSETGHKRDQLTLQSDDMDLTRSHTIALNSEITGMGNQIYKARESLSLHRKTYSREMIPFDQSAHVDAKFNSGTKGFSHETPISLNPNELKIARSHTVAIESKYVCIANETPEKPGNLDGFSQACVTAEDLSKASNSKAGCAESLTVDARNNTSDGSTDLGDMETSRHKTNPTETNRGTVNISMSTSVSEDHSMAVTKSHTMNIEQLDAQSKSLISLPHPEGQFGTSNTITLPDSLDSKEMENRKDPEPRHENGSLLQGSESSLCNSPAVRVDKLSSRNAQTRRMSLADLQSKLRRMSHIINEPTEKLAFDSCTAPLSQLETGSAKSPIKAKSLPVVEYDPKTGSTDKEDNAPPEHFTPEEKPSATASLNLRSKRLTSRLSMGNFIPKLPQKAKPVKPNKVESSNVNSVGEHMRTNTVNITHQLSSNILMDNIDNEVLPNISSDEDLSETQDTKMTIGIDAEESPLQGPNMEDSLVEEVFKESSPSVAHGKKRPSVVDDEDTMQGEKRSKSFIDILEMEQPAQVIGCNSNVTAAPAVIQTVDASNSSNTANLRCDATFESTFKQHMFESQLEDCTNDVQKKLDDDSITMLEFFKLFNFDFVIHNPRQSVLPGKASDLDHTPEDLLKNSHINRPKQMVYEVDNQSLAEKVEGLKARMKDGEKLVKSVNRPLWEEMRSISGEELKCFAAKLKERSNFFRKRSRVQSHEMKEALYSNLRQANLEEQQKLRGKIEETDEMLKSLDDCIHELESELSVVEGKGLEDTNPTLKSSQLGLDKVTRALADNERQTCDLEMQKRHNMDKLNRLQTDTQDLENHITMLHRVNEWRLREELSSCTVYTFLFESFHLRVLFETSRGEDVDDESERNISNITFELHLDDEKSQGHAHLVHKLLSQYTEGETSWAKMYPTSRYVPKLLHDVGLVVSRCRLLGEELHLLKMWGALRLDILDISCVGDQVCIVFSSLKAFVKFELTIAVTAAYPFCVLHVHSFKNHIGSTTIHQVEEIVLSVSPGKNYLTKIVKRIHDALLC